MGYERNDRRFGNPGERGDGSHGADRGREFGQGGRREDERARGDYGAYGASGGRDYRGDRFNERRDGGGDPRGYDHGERGFLDRAGDEVRAWFGDEDAERRRRADDRHVRDEDARYRANYDRGPQGQDRARDVGYGAGYYGTAERDRGAQSGGTHHDPSYRSWRDRQMESFDRDYDEYRREHQSRFDSEFRTWREGRQGQRDLLARVREHQEVVGSDGQHVGTVDHVRGDQIELTKNDQDAGGRHHLIPSSWLQAVDDKVTLAKTADQAKQHWRDEARDAGGADDRSRTQGRSFTGTN